jgi:4-hydroxythreonine-4-phosphate dehydrogenase
MGLKTKTSSPAPRLRGKGSHAPIAITMGDPAGVGAEVVLKALDRHTRRSKTPFLLLGDALLWEATKCRLKLRLPLFPVETPSEATMLKRGVGVLDLGGPDVVEMGKVEATCGEASVSYIRMGVKLAMGGVVRALVTAPIHKEAVHRAGFKYPGHTEMLADWSGTRDFAMMMVGGPFRITLNSIHVSLKDAVKAVTVAQLGRHIDLTHRTLQAWFGIRRPRIMVAGLNPHAGEAGAFGDEELKVISPAIRKACAKGWNVTGPYPPDTLFHRVLKGEGDAVLALYHDQGLIPIKLAAFEKGVNLTLGLPFVRTSPDHGTAFDLAGKGVADPSSMLEAIRLAEKLTE